MEIYRNTNINISEPRPYWTGWTLERLGHTSPRLAASLASILSDAASVGA